MDTLNISKAALNTMRLHGETAYPNECCGFLFGSDGEIRDIQLAQEVVNSQDGDQRKRFEISPLDYMKAEQWAIQNNQDLLGIYHSHPDHPAVPSRHDFRQAVPFFSYIILSIREAHYRKITSWRLSEEGKFIQEEIVLDKSEITAPII